MAPSHQQLQEFQQIIWQYYQAYGRPFAWRETRNPYHIYISEVMLQQTQTHRVIEKFEQFTAAFADFEALAQAPLRDVLYVWQGLGYNRRGMALHNSAKKVMEEYGGILPQTPEQLVNFPGIGPATASSICAFAFNQPTVFIETNIRAVFIHFFFQGRDDVHDKEIMPLVAATVDPHNAREWYYALMDYGVMLKKKFKNPSRKSKHHTQQSKFEGSDRQVRGLVIKALTYNNAMTLQQVVDYTNKEPERVATIVDQLCAEGFLTVKNNHFMIA